MKKVELSEDQAPDTTMEESSTSLAPTLLYLTSFEAAPATEESLILPVTSLWPQVRGLRMALELEESLRPHCEAQGWEGVGRGRGGVGWKPGVLTPISPATARWALHPKRTATIQEKEVLGAHSRDSQGGQCQLSTLVSALRRAKPLGENLTLKSTENNNNVKTVSPRPVMNKQELTLNVCFRPLKEMERAGK